MKKHLWITVLIILMLTLFCMPALADGNHPVTMTVNGSTGASQTVTVNSRNLLTIQAPGATAIRVLNPNRWHSNEEDIETADCWEYYDDRGWNTEYLEIYQVFESGTSFVYAEARYDDHQGNIRDWDGEGDSPWTGVSQRISLTLTNNGQSLAVPSVTMSPAGSVTRGDWLTLSIDNPQGKGEWYWADLDRVYGDGNTEFLNHFDFNSDYDMAIHTDKYEAGSYRLRIYACAAGYADHSHIEKEFTITGSGSTSAFLKVSKTSATVGEEIFISAFAPNENQLRVEMTKQGDPSWFERREWGGSYAQNRWNIDQPGTYVLSLIVNGQAVDTKTVTFAGGAGTLSKPNLSGMPATVTKGQAYSGTFTVDDYAEWVDVNVEYMPDQGNRTKIYQSNRKNTDANFTKLNLPASVISRAGRYKVDVHTRSTGYEDSNTGFVFLVKEADSGTQTLTLTVNGSTDDILSWPSSSNVHIQVQGEGATAIRLLRDENWENVEGWTSGTVHWNKGFGAGDHILIAQMTTDEPSWRADNFDWSKFNWNTDVNWTTLSNPVKIHVASQGRLAEPQVTLKVGSNTLNPNNATVTRGDVLTVTASQQDHAEWIQAEFRILQGDDGGRWWNGIQNGYFASNGQGLTMQIPTAGIPAGSYYLQVGVEAVNWEGSYVYLPLTVVDPEGGVVEPGLEFSRESVQTNETVNILAWAPDAWRMELDISMDGDNNWRDRRETDRDSASWNWECGLGGEYTFTLNYFMPGENGPRTITKKLTVISDGVMDQPVLTGIPDLLYLGNGIQGSFMTVSGAEWYNVGVRYSYNGYNWDDIVNENRNPDQSGATDLNFDKNIFDQEGIYRIWVSANAVGKDNGCTERQIQVIDGSNINENLVLRVNGQTDGSKVNEVYLHMEPEVSVSAPSGVTAVRMINTTSNWQYRLPDQNGMAYCNLGVHQGGYVVFRAQATTDEEVTDWADEHNGDMYGFDWDSVEWSMSSLPVTINVIYFGDLEDPEVTLTSSTVERGDILEFTISPVDHSDYYGYRIRKVLENGLSDYILDNDLSMTEPTTIQIPTDALTAGTYRLDVDPRHYGWHGNESSYTFTVTETTPSTAAVFTTRKYAVLTQETMYFSIYAPGASRVKLCHEKEAIVWSETQGETMVRMVIPNRVRTYHVMAYALYPNENNWTQIGTTLEITVTAPNGTLPDPVITAPNSVLKDEDGVLIAMLTCDYLGTYGQAECWLSSQENVEEYELEQFGRQMNPDGTYTEMFRMDTARLNPGTYTLEAFAIPGAPGYAMGQNTATVTVTQNSDIQATLTADKRILEIFEDVCLNVNAGNSATAIALYSNGEWIYESGASMTEYATAWWEGKMTFFAYYTTEALPNNDSWQNPVWAGWTGVSNIVTVQINPPTQELDLDITVAKTTVQQGEQFKVIITNHNTNLNPSYGATLQKLEESGQFGSSSPWYGPDQEGSNIILVDTRNMQPGNYLLHITANAVGCRGVLEDVNVHINEAVSTLILPSGLTVIEEEAFAGIAAQKIIVPDGVTTIEARAFASCPNLEEIVLPADISSFAGDAFAGCTHQIKTYGSADSYLADYAANVDKLVLVPEE